MFDSSHRQPITIHNHDISCILLEHKIFFRRIKCLKGLETG